MSENQAITKKKAKRGRPPNHGGYSLLAGNNKLPKHKKYIRIYLTNTREGLISDIGPTEDDLTAAQLILVDRAITKLGIVRCMEAYAAEKGVMSEDGLLLPCLGKHYLTYCNSIRLDLQALGIDKRKSDEVIDLGTYLENKEKAGAEND